MLQFFKNLFKPKGAPDAVSVKLDKQEWTHAHNNRIYNTDASLYIVRYDIPNIGPLGVPLTAYQLYQQGEYVEASQDKLKLIYETNRPLLGE